MKIKESVIVYIYNIYVKLIQHIYNVINKDKITSIKYLQQLQTRVPFVGKLRVKYS